MSDAMGNSQEMTSSTPIFGAGREGFEETAREYGRRIAEGASHARDFVSEKATVVGDKIKELQNKDLTEVVDDAKDYARKNPGHAILISAAAGLVLGLLLRGVRR
jgi:ElaB/YqjD/DUF883 family membrane-anchored ribosome-binding protein